MGIDIQEIPGRCGESHHAGTKTLRTNRGGCHHLLHGLIRRAAEFSPKLWMVNV